MTIQLDKMPEGKRFLFGFLKRKIDECCKKESELNLEGKAFSREATAVSMSYFRMLTQVILLGGAYEE